MDFDASRIILWPEYATMSSPAAAIGGRLSSCWLACWVIMLTSNVEDFTPSETKTWMDSAPCDWAGWQESIESMIVHAEIDEE